MHELGTHSESDDESKKASLSYGTHSSGNTQQTASETAPFRPDSPSVVMKGILLKKGRSTLYNATWKLRSVYLDKSNKLYYFDGDKMKGEVNLVGTQVSHVDPGQADGKLHAFLISGIRNPKRGQSDFVLLGAGSLSESLEWVGSISEMIDLNSKGKSVIGGYLTFEDIAAHNKQHPLNLRDIKERRRAEYQRKMEVMDNS